MKQNEYSISPIKTRKGTTTYRVYMGKVNGQNKFRQFQDLKIAQKFVKSLNRDFELKRMGYEERFGIMLDRKNEILFALEEADKMNVSLNDLIEFYKKHGNVFSKQLTISEAIETFKKGKQREEASEIYIRQILSYFHHFEDYVKGDTLVHDITKSQIEKYVFIHRKNVSARTKKNCITNLRLLFNFLIEEGYLSINPANNIKPPKTVAKQPEILTVKDLRTVLDTSLTKGYYRECVIMVLQCFCGVRVAEASRLTWKSIDIKNRSVHVTSEDAKIGMFRYVDITENAYRYLVLCLEGLQIRAKHKDELILVNPESKMTAVRKIVGVKMPVNVLRHSFGTYHYAAYQDVKQTRRLMGHIGNENTFHNHYNNKTITKEQGLKYFDIYPLKKTSETFDYQSVKKSLLG